MKRCLISLLIVVCVVVMAVWLWQSPRRAVRSELHPLYLRYERDPDVAAGFVKDLRIADTVTIDVVTLQAKDTVAWFRMLEQLDFKTEIIDKAREYYSNRTNFFITFNTEKNRTPPTDMAEAWNKDAVICSPLDLTVCIYDLTSKTQDSILMELEIDKMLNQ